ncbi:proline dehydrogenase family protein [Mariniluteicoccus endophyticus]
MDPVRQALMSVARNEQIKDVAMGLPPTRKVVDRFVAGEQADDAVHAVADLGSRGIVATIDHLGEDTTDLDQAQRTAEAYLVLLEKLGEAGLAAGVDLSLKLSALGQFLGERGEQHALDHARAVATAARNAGATITIDMEDHTTTSSTLGIVSELRKDFPSTGTVLQAYLRRSEADCAELATTGSRIRLCKGAYAEPETVAYTTKKEIDRAYVRCLRTLMEGDGYPMVATHDPRLVAIALDLASRNHREKDSWELQMLYGIRPQEQDRLAAEGHTMRVYIPYGTDWYGYLVRRLAEKPANLSFFLRGLVDRR